MKLSEAMLDVLRTVQEGAGVPADRPRLRALWKRGLIADRVEGGVWTGYALTPEGRLALQRGRQMVSRRTR